MSEKLEVFIKTGVRASSPEGKKGRWEMRGLCREGTRKVGRAK
jgi:hypothetical protein